MLVRSGSTVDLRTRQLGSPGTGPAAQVVDGYAGQRTSVAGYLLFAKSLEPPDEQRTELWGIPSEGASAFAFTRTDGESRSQRVRTWRKCGRCSALR